MGGIVTPLWEGKETEGKIRCLAVQMKFAVVEGGGGCNEKNKIWLITWHLCIRIMEWIRKREKVDRRPAPVWLLCPVSWHWSHPVSKHLLQCMIGWLNCWDVCFFLLYPTLYPWISISNRPQYWSDDWKSNIWFPPLKCVHRFVSLEHCGPIGTGLGYCCHRVTTRPHTTRGWDYQGDKERGKGAARGESK